MTRSSNSIFRFPRRVPRDRFPQEERGRALSRRATLSLLLVFFLFASGMGVAGFLYFKNQKAQLRRATLYELSTIADLKVQGISNWRWERIWDAFRSTRNPLITRPVRSWFENPSDARLRAQLARWLTNFRSDREYVSVLLLDAQGSVRLSSPEGATVDPQVLSQAASSPAGSGPTLGGFRRAGPGGKILLSLSAPVLDPESREQAPIGFLLFVIDPSQFLYPYIQRWPTPSPTGETILVQREGNDVVYLNELRHWKGTALTLRRPLSDPNRAAARAVLMGAGTVEGKDYAGVPVLAAFRPVPGSSWVLVAKVSEKEAYASLRQSASLLGVSTAALVFGTGVTLLFLAGRHAAHQERRALEAVRESEARFRVFMSNVPAAVFIKDAEGRYLYANPETERIFSMSLPAILGNTDEALLSPETARAFRENDRRAMDEGRSIRTTEVFQQADGAEHTFLVSKFVLPGPRSATAELAGVAFDISDRLQTEKRLTESEERFRTTFENAPVGIAILDLQDRFLRGNSTLSRMLGYTGDELRQLTFTAITRPVDLEAELPRLRRLLAGEIPTYTLEKRYLRKDGSDLWVRVTSSIARTGDPHRITIVEDIQERKAAEEALRQKEIELQTEAQFRQLAEGLPNLVWISRADGSVEYFNQRWYDYTGTPFGTFTDEKWLNVLHPTDRERTLARWQQSVRTGEDYEIDYRLRQARDRAYRWFLGRALPVRDAHGRVVRWFGTCTDIQDQKDAQEALRAAREIADAASQAKSEFLANMSHEIRTPMNGVMGMTDLLLETEPTPIQRQYLEMVKSSAESLLTVINDILDFSKIEAGKLELEEVEFGLRDTVESAVDALAFRAHQKGLEILDFVDPELPDLHVGDPTRLRQVLINLLGNAIKFTDRGEVVLRVTRSPDVTPGPGTCPLRFSVRDTGIGIPEEKRDALFRSFSQIDASVGRRYGGTGLGLAISKRILDRMGGRIWFESREGRGSTFFFELELRAAEEKPECRARPPSDLAGLTALVVDDNATNRDILITILQSRGMSVTSTGRGQDAVERLLAAHRGGRPFDVALVDEHMPEMDGRAVVERIRNDLPLEDLVILMITSEDVPGGARRARELGTGTYLVKPVRLQPLLDAIAQVRGVQLETRPRGPGPGAREPCAAGEVEIRGGIRVLLAEDNAINRTVVEAFLGRRNVSVKSVEDGRGAVDAYAAGVYDLVLMDVQMPGMDGLEATKELRRRGSRVPIVGLTAHAMKGDREKCLEAGMDDYIPKPVAPDVLFRKVARWTGAACEAEPPREPPADVPKLLQTLGGDKGVLRVMTEQLKETSAALLPEIDKALKSGDPTALLEAAHKLKGGLLVFGAEETIQYVGELERLGRSGSTEGGREILAELGPAMDELLRYLTES